MLRSLTALFAALLPLVAAPAARALQTCPQDDAYAPNHTCLLGTQLGQTIQWVDVDLLVENSRPDYFLIPYDPGSEIYIRAAFDHVDGDIDLELFAEWNCDTGSPSASSVGTGDVEEIRVGSSAPFVLKVSRTGGPGDCSPYRLSILMDRNSTQLGGTLCNGNLNSTGWYSTFSVLGSAAVADDDVRLEAYGLPQNAFGMFLNSRGQGYWTPPASQGTLCIDDGAIGRFNRAGEIQQTSPVQPFLSLTLDLDDIPTPMGATHIAAGERWAFQCWYRDVTSSGAATSNFSGAVVVWFE